MQRVSRGDFYVVREIKLSNMLYIINIIALSMLQGSKSVFENHVDDRFNIVKFSISIYPISATGVYVYVHM